MKKYRKFSRTSWCIRTIINCVLIVSLIPVYYISVGRPPLSPKHQFRRVEKAAMVGPAKILDTISLDEYEGYNADRLLLATSEEGVTLFAYDKKKPEYYSHLIYREKQGDITVLAYGDGGYTSRGYAEVPIIVFDEYPDAVRAEMKIDLHTPTYIELKWSEQYSLSAEREHEGYFLFTLKIGNGITLSNVDWALDLLAELSSGHGHRDEAIPVTVWFYDEDGNMIFERSVVIRSIAGEAHN